MIDLHCHLLPGVDDGAPDLESALDLARASVANGITEAVLTPHVFPGRWPNTVASLRPAFAQFERTLREQGVPLKVHLGGEVHLHPDSLGMLDRDELPMIGALENRRVMLLELPDGFIPVGAINAVRFLMARDVLPLIAHPERNKDVMRDPRKIEPFVREGCLLQLTAASVCGRFGPACLNTSNRLLDQGWVTLVATDTHSLAWRPPMLQEAYGALVERYGAQAADLLTEENPRTIVAGRRNLHSLQAADSLHAGV